jgi:2-C-methyl-D-erythritol 2,4-cyclodiphosphate synthase
MSKGLRVGVGYDAHRLAPGRALVLGGITIPSEKGLAGHSDGDVAVHASIDALLGAAALGDIGTHFPAGESRYEGINSLRLLSETRDLLSANGWRVHNLDATIVAEVPKLAPYIEQMRKTIEECLGTGPGAVSIKATTADGLGFTGKGEGITAHAVATIEPIQ